jgi:hypothetical protein
MNAACAVPVLRPPSGEKLARDARHLKPRDDRFKAIDR